MVITSWFSPLLTIGMISTFLNECFRSVISVAGGWSGLLEIVASSRMEMWCLRMLVRFLYSSYSIIVLYQQLQKAAKYSASGVEPDYRYLKGSYTKCLSWRFSSFNHLAPWKKWNSSPQAYMSNIFRWCTHWEYDWLLVLISPCINDQDNAA